MPRYTSFTWSIVVGAFLFVASSCGGDIEQDVDTSYVNEPVFGVAGGPLPEIGKQLAPISVESAFFSLTTKEVIGSYVGESTEIWKECSQSSLNGTLSFDARMLITPVSNSINGTLTIEAGPALTVVYTLRNFSISENVLGASIVDATTLQGDTLGGFESGEFKANITEGSIAFDYAWVNTFSDTTCRNIKGEGTLHKTKGFFFHAPAHS
tara:strand:+ start:3343 stop:3972 length:630 start_codon:yes stop_codon:yes gene_type:complete